MSTAFSLREARKTLLRFKKKDKKKYIDVFKNLYYRTGKSTEGTCNNFHCSRAD
ncbi:hypothetical protein HNQ36_003984 [Afipia massiliensis]|uniref:Uncharacterized protein n=1 Tax=Afipia massiliensis TaxID=211460 RepID=A0A840N5V6_9BRAD|nr:hypothetical protein [Afipia massiliensis]